MKGIVIGCVLLLSMTAFSGCRSQLPEDAPNDLEIRFESTTVLSDGEPKHSIRSVTISGDQMTLVRNACQKAATVTLDDAAAQAIYRAFVKDGFDLIRQPETLAGGTDAGYEEIYLKAGHVSKKVRKGKQYPLSAEDLNRFNRLLTMIMDLTERNFSFRCEE